MVGLPHPSRWFAADPLSFYEPTVQMLPLHQSLADKRLSLKPNQVGGTHVLGVEMWWAVTNTHPWRAPIVPKLPLWVLIPNLDKEYKVVCRKFHATEPTSRLHTDCRYIDNVGYRYRGGNSIVMADGRAIEFRSGTQELTALESETLAMLLINEPPKPGHWGAALARTAVCGAPVLMVFTAVGRPLDWLKAEVWGNPEEGIPPKDPSWDIHIGELTESACTTPAGRIIRSEASIREQMIRCPAAEYNQRIRAGWDGVATDRRFDGYDEETLSSDVPYQSWEVLLGIDHGEGGGRQVCLLIFWCPTTPLMIIRDEYVNTTTSDIEMDAEGIKAMLARHNLGPKNVDRAVGDTNTAGKAAAGRTVNELLGQALGIRIRPAEKGPGSVQSGAVTINQALRRAQLRVHPDAVGADKALRYWAGKDDEFKHYVDGLRYIGVPLLARAVRVASPELAMP